MNNVFKRIIVDSRLAQFLFNGYIRTEMRGSNEIVKLGKAAKASKLNDFYLQGVS